MNSLHLNQEIFDSLKNGLKNTEKNLNPKKPDLTYSILLVAWVIVVFFCLNKLGPFEVRWEPLVLSGCMLSISFYSIVSLGSLIWKRIQINKKAKVLEESLNLAIGRIDVTNLDKIHIKISGNDTVNLVRYTCHYSRGKEIKLPNNLELTSMGFYEFSPKAEFGEYFLYGFNIVGKKMMRIDIEDIENFKRIGNYGLEFSLKGQNDCLKIYFSSEDINILVETYYDIKRKLEVKKAFRF